MEFSKNGLNFLISLEGLKLNAYKDSKGIPTIGIGNTYYPNGNKVKLGDTLTKDEAIELCLTIINKDFAPTINSLIKSELTQNQFDALICIAYNIGITAFKNSSLLKAVNTTPNSREIIEYRFCQWRYCNGKPILLSRRRKEVKYYFS